MCMLDNFQRLIFGNGQSPDKFTGKHKITTITTKPLMERRIRQQEVGEDKTKVEVVEEIGIGGIVIRPLYGKRKLRMRPMPFATLSTCASLMSRATR